MTKLHLYILLLTLSSCFSDPPPPRLNYIESQPSFYALRHGDWTQNTWIRQPENLRMIHETFKEFGYWKLISNDLDESPPIDVNKPARHLIDSLIIAFETSELEVVYYREFWERRAKEGNDSIVYTILKDIQYAVLSEQHSDTLAFNATDSIINDTLYQLLEIEYPQTALTTELATEHFETLLQLGFHESAYNLLFERVGYYSLNWDQTQLQQRLVTTDSIVYPWIIDNSP